MWKVIDVSADHVIASLTYVQKIGSEMYEPFNSQDLISNSPYCPPNDSHYVIVENLVTDQLAIR